MKKSFSVIYVVNIVVQALFTLLWQIALALLISWAAVKYLSAPDWIYVPLILLGVFSGLFSMIRFILSSMRSLERLEDQHERDRIGKKNTSGKEGGNT